MPAGFIMMNKRECTPFKPKTLMIMNLFDIYILFIFDVTMNGNTTISLGSYFDQFVQSQISSGRYKNESEVIQAGLRLLENEESRVIALKEAIKEGLDSPRVDDFYFDGHLAKLKTLKRKNG
jgi:antitoxin ParD1/3/4